MHWHINELKYMKYCTKEHEHIGLRIAYPKTLPKLNPQKTIATALDRSCNGMDLHVNASASMRVATTIAKYQKKNCMNHCVS
jgi:hypothetical protein